MAFLLVAAAPASAPRVLAGNWAGSGVAVRQSPSGMIVQGRCVSGMMQGPVPLAADGSFAAAGYFNPHRSGYRLSDLAPRDSFASFRGKVAGRRLDLVVQAKGKPEARYVLLQGARARFPKCS